MKKKGELKLSILDRFEITSGSIVGRDHIGSGNVLLGKNKQDAIAIKTTDDFIVAIVCDGCGSGKDSEVGAKVGAQLISEKISNNLTDLILAGYTPSEITVRSILEATRTSVILEIKKLASSMGSSLSQIVNDYFLFTIVGAVIWQDLCCVFSIGDGTYAMNDDVVQTIGPFPNDAPPYLSYAITGSTLLDESPELLKFKIQQVEDNVNYVLIGTDGVEDLVKVEERLMPGTTKPVGPLSQFWEDDKYFTNPDAIRRKLALANRDFVKKDRLTNELVRNHGLLPDDTSLVVIRRKRD